MTDSPKYSRPVLAQHARFRWDAVRGQHEIVYPEGVLVLNESGAAIVSRCDGRTVEEIAADLAGGSGDRQAETDVPRFLRRLADKGLLREAPAT